MKFDIGALVAEAIKQIPSQPAVPVPPKEKTGGYKASDYPLMRQHRDQVISSSGKQMDEITVEAISSGEIGLKDVCISKNVLLRQAEIAENAGKTQLAQNFRRAAELVEIPSDTVFQIYHSLQPYQSTKDQLDQLAKTLKQKYGAELCAELVQEAKRAYEARGFLLQEAQ